VAVVGRLPSAGIEPAGLGDLTADANHVRDQLDTLDEPVVLVGHSYGGAVITELADHPKVRHSVYVAAFLLRRGESALDVFTRTTKSESESIVPGGDGSLRISDDLDLVREALCADLDRDRAHEALSRFVPQSVAAVGAPSTAPDRTHPATYVIAEQDNFIPVAAQEEMAANADDVVRLPAGHMVQLSRPDELAEVLGRI
jgi:pimeloyl-ACP methyl ester carboxylesterase